MQLAIYEDKYLLTEEEVEKVESLVEELRSLDLDPIIEEQAINTLGWVLRDISRLNTEKVTLMQHLNVAELIVIANTLASKYPRYGTFQVPFVDGSRRLPFELETEPVGEEL